MHFTPTMDWKKSLEVATSIFGREHQRPAMPKTVLPGTALLLTSIVNSVSPGLQIPELGTDGAAVPSNKTLPSARVCSLGVSWPDGREGPDAHKLVAGSKISHVARPPPSPLDVELPPQARTAGQWSLTHDLACRTFVSTRKSYDLISNSCQPLATFAIHCLIRANLFPS